MAKRLRSYTDEILIEPDGTLIGWACALNDLSAAGLPMEKIELQECAAPRGDCPRGFQKRFECRY